ncbi:rRNA cytosine-C5-methyltransferase [Actinomadura sp. ATCC 31491]|uniref:rRNA cytosine-C5-methyltransferase n=1 Tax=Actinomadura luzonensis TaxID=2805427 RepID=A0ABT0G8A8_9ACTN|nr:transcription antitermination factor NusB [Actinomadura luzonensis]MCK2220812.1 rRNA cytosine-C5-methyltransferase [Actinomadura luzonensis]
MSTRGEHQDGAGGPRGTARGAGDGRGTARGAGDGRGTGSSTGTGTGGGSGRRRPGQGRPGQGRGGPRIPRDEARLAAFDVLRAVDERDSYANLLLPRLLRERGIKGRDAALATELAYGTLRGLGTYDAIIEVCSDRAPDPAVRDALRLGAHQLLRMRVPPHAAVGTTVDLVRLRVGPGPAKFANAVLRKIASRTVEEWLPIVAPDPGADPVGHLAVAHAHPRWIVSAFRDALGGDAELPDLLAADNARPLVTLVARPGRSDLEELAEYGATPGRYSPYAAYLPEGDPGQIEAVAETRAAVQDEASQLVALALTRVPITGHPAGSLVSPDGTLGDGATRARASRGDEAVERWLDMCAGPGGKAGLLDAVAAYGDVSGGPSGFPGGALLLAADVQYHRARLVWQTTRRAAVVTADGTEPAWRPGVFDRVMLDAPCTGLGALRRRPEARWRRDPAGIAELGRLQRLLLGAALDAVRPGGVVAYVTCSPHLAETRVVVGDVLARRADAEQLDAREYLPEVDGLGDGPHAQFWPHRHGTDAMFLALLRRRPS